MRGAAAHVIVHAQAIAVCLVLSGCGADFVEVNPPQLERQVRQLTVGTVEEPVVYGLIFDLDLPDASSCQSAQLRLEEAARMAFQSRDAHAIELPTQDVSPGCRQQDQRMLDADAFFNAIETLQLPPRAAVRPVFVYFNNVDLYLPQTLQYQLLDLHSRAASPSTNPQIWAVAAPTVLQWGEAFDWAVRWSYSGDPELASQLLALAERILPFESRAIHALDEIPLFDQGVTGIQSFKVCGDPGGIYPYGFQLDGTAASVAPATPPTFELATPDIIAAPQGELETTTIAIPLEVCRAHCDRYVEGTPPTENAFWNKAPGCFLPAP